MEVNNNTPTAHKIFNPLEHGSVLAEPLIQTSNNIQYKSLVPYAPADAAKQPPRVGQGARADPPPAPLLAAIDEDAFWELITRCQWANKDDGRRGSVAHIKQLPSNKYAQFMAQYDRIYDGLKNVLDVARVFTIREITSQLEIRKIVSHVIGLGRESYMTIMTGENTFIEYFIDNDQCISLDALI